jgi:hypothetical protein
MIMPVEINPGYTSARKFPLVILDNDPVSVTIIVVVLVAVVKDGWSVIAPGVNVVVNVTFAEPLNVTADDVECPLIRKVLEVCKEVAVSVLP